MGLGRGQRVNPGVLLGELLGRVVRAGQWTGIEDS